MLQMEGRRRGRPPKAEGARAGAGAVGVIHLHALVLTARTEVASGPGAAQRTPLAAAPNLPAFPVCECPNCGGRAWVGTHYPQMEDKEGRDDPDITEYTLPEHVIIRCFLCSREFLMLVAGDSAWRKLPFRSADGLIVRDW